MSLEARQRRVSESVALVWKADERGKEARRAAVRTIVRQSGKLNCLVSRRYLLKKMSPEDRPIQIVTLAYVLATCPSCKPAPAAGAPLALIFVQTHKTRAARFAKTLFGAEADLALYLADSKVRHIVGQQRTRSSGRARGGGLRSGREEDPRVIADPPGHATARPTAAGAMQRPLSPPSVSVRPSVCVCFARSMCASLPK